MIILHASNLFYVLLTLKWIQKWILDPVLDLLIGYKTSVGWRRERKERSYENSPENIKVSSHPKISNL